ncbi:MAG: type I-A CRISPR-associated protein Cas4/Csa1, partial [Conexivisphaerales archaeon]|nr:type I-A CRISPR-associated protein Cas4/Csa1 [Conexivisphaerales archaeon]
MFFAGSDMEKRLALLRDELSARPVSEEVRGWSYSQSPVRPPTSRVTLTVSELAARYCETLRDVYLRRVKRVEQPFTWKLARGAVFHEVIRHTTSECKRLIFSLPSACGSDLLSKFADEDMFPLVAKLLSRGEREKAELPDAEALAREAADLHRYLLIQVASRLDDARSRFPHAEEDSLVAAAVPSVSERKVDGTLVGLSRELSVDLYTPYNAVVDVKTGEARDFHALTAAGYALALESEGEAEVNYGVIAYLRMSGKVPSV